MKKIISLIISLSLLLACLLSFASCGGGDVSEDAEDQITLVNSMFESLVPSQSVTTTTQKIGALTLTSVATLTIGTVDGASAATYVNVYESLAELDGSTNANLVTKKTQKIWYVEGKGICKNGNGKWLADGENFAPQVGDIKLNLNTGKLESATYDAATETLVMTLNKANSNDLLKRFLMEDQSVTSGMTVTIKTAGGRIASLKLEYTAPEHDVLLGEDGADDGEYVTIPEAQIIIEAIYNYDLMEVTLE